MKKICLLNLHLTTFGGAERVTINLANELVNYYEVTVVSLFARGNKSAYPLSERVRLIMPWIPETIRLRYHYLEYCLKLRSFLVIEGFQQVVFVGLGSWAYLPSLCWVKTGVVICEHSNLNNTMYNNPRSALYRLFGKLFATKLITLTKSDAVSYRKKYRIRMSRLDYIYNWVGEGFDYGYDKNNVEQKKLLTIGRFDPVKGYEILLNVAEKMRKKDNNWIWEVYGEPQGEYYRSINKQINERGLSEAVRLKPVTTKIADVYRGASIYICTSLFEGLPMTLIEAKSIGLPIVSFDIETGPREIVEDGVNGCLIRPYDEKEMADRILDLLSNGKKLMEFSKNSQTDMFKFKKEFIMEKWRAILDEGIV